MSYLQRIETCNNATLGNYSPFLIDNYHVGWIKHENQALLNPWFDTEALKGGVISLISEDGSFEGRNKLLAEVVTELYKKDAIRAPMQELYPVSLDNRSQVIALVDRVAASFFGIRCYGQHLNGYVRDGDQIKMWIGRRARDRGVEPGKLDQLVAGGLPHSIEPHHNLLKECYEEAGIKPELAKQAKAVGTISYFAESGIGLKPDTLYLYDLELPAGFKPICTDGEVEEFYLMPIGEVAEMVRNTTEFKHNCNLVVIDFLVRHGFLSDNEADYTTIVAGLHPTLPKIGF